MHHTTHRRWMLPFIGISLALSIATPVLAAYIGPKRTVTETSTVCKVILNECQYVEAKNEWDYKTQDTWSCSLESKPWQAYSNDRRPCNENNPGYEFWSKEDVTRTETITYPPATISSSLENCTLRNGWCATIPQLSLDGIEPVSGHRIIAIEGTFNGQNFACASSSCSVSLEEGDNDFTYWALSSFLDSSEMGTLTAKVDSQSPAITSTLSGTPGLNGWYLGPATLTSSATDAGSGVASFTCTRDGITLGSCNTISISGEGPHTLVVIALDTAGHARTLNRTVSIDTQSPTLNASINGTLGANTWYTSAVLNASASDLSPGSGLSVFQYSLDGSSWKIFPVSGTLSLPEGKHSVNLRATDKAGRTVSSPTSFWLDSSAPDLHLESSGTIGSNNWYTTSPILTGSASDDTSGLDSFEYNLDNNGWTAYTAPLSLPDGIHSISFWAQDQAGLVTQVDRAYQVDTRLPQIAGSLSGTPGANGWFISDVMISASAFDPLPGSDIDTFTYVLDGSPETPYTDPLTISNGQHTIQLVARDQAGLLYSVEQTCNVDTIPPSVKVDTELPAWVKGTITLNGTAGDDGSGLSSTEISLDGGETWHLVTGAEPWSDVWNTTEGPNGIQEIRLRAMDQAGLITEHTVNAGVDNLSPQVSLPDLWLQWDTVTLNILDEHSGLAEARVEISDPEGRWPTRVIPLDPAQFPLEFKWDRRFGDGTIAEAGKYDVRVYASDHLGNTVETNAAIRVLIEILPPGPTSTTQPPTPTTQSPTPTTQPPTPTVPVKTNTPTPSRTATPVHAATQTLVPTTPAKITTPTLAPSATQITLVFGTIEPPVQATATAVTTFTPRPTPTQSNAVEWLESIIAPETSEERITEIGLPQESAPLPAETNNSVLWGTAATAAIAAATAYAEEQKRKREAEKARLEALEEAKEERRKNRKEQKTAKMEAQRVQEALWAAAQQEELNQSYPLHTEVKIAKMEEEEGLLNSLKASPPETNHSAPSSEEKRAERKNEIIEQEINSYTAKPQEWESAYQSYMEQKAAEEAARQAAIKAALTKTEETSSSAPPKEKPWWETAVEWVDNHQKEIALGLGVVAGAAVVILSGGFATPLVAAALIGSATLAAGGTMAGITVGLNLYHERPWHENLLTNAALAGGVALAVATGGFLYNAMAAGGSTFCSINPGTCQLASPALKIVDTVEQTLLQAKLAYYTWTGNEQSAAEAALELHTEMIDGGMPGNSVIKELSEQITDLKSVIPLIKNHGEGVIQLLTKYGDDALRLLQRYGPDVINVYQAQNLLETLDENVLEYAIKQGPDAVNALSRWSPEELRLHGPELALRAKKDGKVLKAIEELNSLGPIDPQNLTAEQQQLINEIAANSTQNAEASQVVLGKWVDINSGFVETAQNTGSLHYNPHPAMWNKLGSLGKAKQEEVAWLINKQVVQNGIDKGLPFQYTLNGIPTENVIKEEKAVEAIFAGATDAEIMKLLKSEYVPVRMKELQELYKAKYKLSFNEVNNSYVLVKP